MKLVPLRNCLERFPLDVAKSILDNEGIPCQLMNEHISNVAPHLALVNGGVDLLVAEEDLEEAERVLKEYRESAGPILDNPDSIMPCPKCQSNEVDEVLQPEPFSILALFLFFGIPVKVRKKRKHCKKCGFIWRD